MNIHITKGARQYGYLIWNNKTNTEIEKMLEGLTRALPKEHDTFSVSYVDGVLEVKSFNGRQ